MHSPNYRQNIKDLLQGASTDPRFLTYLDQEDTGSNQHPGVWPSGKATGFDPVMRRFESCHPSQFLTILHPASPCNLILNKATT